MPTRSELVYDGFISYSHAADGLLAPRLQFALQRFAKPWWKRRAIRLFRDESSLSANPHLWSSITEALDSSPWFVLLLSPDAAQSPWVNQEIDYWKTNKDPSRILPVVTDGTFTWDGTDITGDAVPDALQGVFTEEPRWVDLRFARGEDQLDLKNPRFSAAVADIASALRVVPKDELESEEVKQHRRTIRTAWTAGVVVIALGIAAALAAVQANRQAQLALARELAASAVNVLQDDPELAILLTLEAMERTPEGIDQPVEVINALWEAVQEDRLVTVIDTESGGPVGIALSTDGTLLAVASVNDSTLRLYSAPHGVELWSYTEDTTDTFGLSFLSPDGKMVAVGIWDSAGHPARSLGERPSDDLPGRFVVLDTTDGSVIETVEYPDCAGATAQGWSSLGTYFAVSNVDSCPRPGASDGGWVEILDGETFERVALVETLEGVAPYASFDQSENLYIFGAEENQGVEIYPAPDFRFSRVVDQIIGVGSVSPDGSMAVSWTLGGSAGLSLGNIETGQVTDLLRPSPSPPGGFYRGPHFSADGTRVLMGTIGDNTSVWDVGTGERIFDVVGGPATAAAMSTDGKRLYTGHTNGSVKVWNLDPAGGLESVGDLGSYGHINSNTFALGPELVAASAFDLSAFAGAMVFFDKATGALHGDPVAAWSPVFSAALANNLFALRNQEGVWIVYDPMTGAQTHLAGCPLDQNGQTCTDSGEPAPRIDVLASTDGTELAFSINSGPTANQLYDGAPFTLVDLDTGSEIGPLAPGRLDLDVQVFSDEWLLGWSEDGATHVAVDRITGEELARPDVPPFQRWEASASGGTIAILEPGGSALTIVDTNTWETSSVEFSLGNPRGLSFSPGERRIALGDENGLHIASIESGVIEQSIPLPSVSDIHWFDADNVLVGGSALGGTEGMWSRVPLNTRDLIALAKDNLTRGFSSKECAAYRIDPCPTLEEMREG
ncbi:MAG TPA: TIR domain-containing protein [Acidimicrobiia bacterium]|nr:TIR domain-containing protein [Acidimicrobiia bacterium]